jgi:glycosyltransferase involved in cell wall biosynthesis
MISNLFVLCLRLREPIIGRYQAMRVVHISTYDIDGGAARAAYRLHESLLGAGQQSTMLVRTRHSQDKSVQSFELRKNSDSLFGSLIQKYYADYNRTELSTTCFSLGWPGQDLSSHPLVQAADIIHLHWVSDFVSPASLARLQALGKPLVWTLHDQRPFTGGCHYSAGCRQFEHDCRDCPQLVSDPCRLPRATLSDQCRIAASAPITIITPSRWMAECARRSTVFGRSRIEVIPYGIDTGRFQAIPQQDARTRLVLPQDSLLLLFGVDNAREKRKGLHELFAALAKCGLDQNFHRAAAQQKASLLCFGDIDATPELPIPVRSFGRVRSDDILNSLYSATDLFLLPSLEDNLPNTVLESMCCGTPVGAYRTGGVPDLVLEGQTGFLAPAGDLQALGKMIVESINNVAELRKMRAACRRHVENHFTYAHQAQACLALYQELMEARRAPLISASHVPQTSDAESEFRRALGPILKFVFDCDPDLPPPWGGSGTSEIENAAAAKLKLRLKKLLKRAVKRSWSYQKLRAALKGELEIREGTNAYATRAKLLLKRWLNLL